MIGAKFIFKWTFFVSIQSFWYCEKALNQQWRFYKDCLVLPSEQMLLQRYPYHSVKNLSPDFYCFVNAHVFSAVDPIAKLPSNSRSSSKRDNLLDNINNYLRVFAAPLCPEIQDSVLVACVTQNIHQFLHQKIYVSISWTSHNLLKSLYFSSFLNLCSIWLLFSGFSSVLGLEPNL